MVLVIEIRKIVGGIDFKGILNILFGYVKFEILMRYLRGDI